MKKTLAVFLTVLLVLSLAPSVFAGSNIFNTLEDDSGAGSTDQVYTEVDALRNGKYIFAHVTFNGKVYAMSNKPKETGSATYGMGLLSEELTDVTVEGNTVTIKNPPESVIWESEYDADDGSILTNMENKEYLHLGAGEEDYLGTDKDTMMSWVWGPDDRSISGNVNRNVLKTVEEYPHGRTVLQCYVSGNYSFMTQRYCAPDGLVRMFKLYDPNATEEPEPSEALATNPPVTKYGTVTGTFFGTTIVNQDRFEPGTYIIATSNNMAVTDTASKEGKVPGLVAASVSTTVIDDKPAIVDPDASIVWTVTEPMEGWYKFRHYARTEEYLTGGANNDEGLHMDADENAFYQVWVVNRPTNPSGTDPKPYSLRPNGLEGRYAFLSYNEANGNFILSDDVNDLNLILYKLDGEPEYSPTIPSDEPTDVPVSTAPASEVPVTTAPVSEVPVTSEPASEVPATTEPAVNTFTVTFKDWDGTVLDTQEVPEGGAATAPENPTRENWIFTGWDNEFANVTTDLTVTAQYTKLGDLNGDSDVNAADATMVLRALVESIELTKEQELFADANHNGVVEAADATVILRHTVGAVVIDYGEEK